MSKQRNTVFQAIERKHNMHRHTAILIVSLFTGITVQARDSVAEGAARQVTAPVNLLHLITSGQMDYHIAPQYAVHDPASDIFQITNGILRISGRGYGYVATRETYRDYHLVIEFKWGEQTWGERAAKARDSGVLVHAHGAHGSVYKTWIPCVEANLIEGGMGDIYVVNPKGALRPCSVQVEAWRDRSGDWRWRPGAPRQTITDGRVRWLGCDEAWKDVKGFRGRRDIDVPAGEWNRLEIIAQGKTLRYLYNGWLVNEAHAVAPDEGKICLQTEAAELWVRRFELLPLFRLPPPDE